MDFIHWKESSDPTLDDRFEYAGGSSDKNDDAPDSDLDLKRGTRIPSSSSWSSRLLTGFLVPTTTPRDILIMGVDGSVVVTSHCLKVHVKK